MWTENEMHSLSRINFDQIHSIKKEKKESRKKCCIFSETETQVQMTNTPNILHFISQAKAFNVI